MKAAEVLLTPSLPLAVRSQLLPLCRQTLLHASCQKVPWHFLRY